MCAAFAEKAFVINSRYGNIDGGYKQVDTDEDGRGVFFDEEDGKWLYYLSWARKWFIADEKFSRSTYESSGETDARDPGDAPWDGTDVSIAPVDLAAAGSDVWDPAGGNDERCACSVLLCFACCSCVSAICPRCICSTPSHRARPSIPTLSEPSHSTHSTHSTHSIRLILNSRLDGPGTWMDDSLKT